MLTWLATRRRKAAATVTPDQTFTLSAELPPGQTGQQCLDGTDWQLRHPGGQALPSRAVVKVVHVEAATRTLFVAPVLLPHLPAW